MIDIVGGATIDAVCGAIVAVAVPKLLLMIQLYYGRSLI